MIDEIEAAYPEYLEMTGDNDSSLSRRMYYLTCIDATKQNANLKSGVRLRLILKLNILIELANENDDNRETLMQALDAS
jgi:hypothetical protein